jgi:uncharacterized membrane protein
VFIRTVNKHTATMKESSAQRQSEGTVAVVEEEVFQEINRCGCTRFTTQVMICVAVALTVLFWVLAVVTAFFGLFFILGALSLIVAVLGICLVCCACCRPAAGADE